MLASPYGAVAFIGAYNTASRGMNALMEGLCSGIFNGGNERLGDALIYGFSNLELPETVKKYHPVVTEAERARSAWQFHLFGDPALKTGESVSTDTEDGNSTSLQTTLSVYPNPSDDTVYINPEGAEIKNIRVLNLQGICMGEYQCNWFSLAGLPSGMYLMDIQTSTGFSRHKFIRN